MEPNTKKKWYVVAGIVNIFLAFALGYFIGTAKTIQRSIVSEQGNIEINKVLDLYGKSRSSSVNFDQFWKVWDMVKKNHVHQPVDEVKLFYGAIEGLVAGLEDPYSVYFPPKKAEEFASDLSGKFEGIGAEIGKKDDIISIISPLPGSPAEKAGLKIGDKIYAIDGKSIRGFSTDEAVKLIRGAHGTEVTLTIASLNSEKTRDVVLKRDKIVVPTVVWEKKEKAIAYMRIAYFNDETSSQFRKAVNEIIAFKPKGIILDLRSNPGGYLTTSVEVASEWVKEGVIVKEKFNDKTEKEYSSVGSHVFAEIPTLVLVDDNTASGSEIVAGALQDYGLGKLIGKKTFGKGSVQNLEPLSDGSALKLTIANWFTPKDRAIDKLGITPDYVLEETVKEDAKMPKGYKDLALEKALELFSKK